MAILTRQPTNDNLATKYRHTFVLNKLPRTIYRLQEAPIPGLSASPAETENPFTRLKYSPDKLEFADLSIRFLIDEDLSNWIEVYNWLTGIAFPQSFDQYAAIATKNQSQSVAGNPGTVYDDAVLTIYSGKMNPLVRVKFAECFPINLEGLTYQTDGDDNYLTGQATFAYQYYTIDQIT